MRAFIAIDLDDSIKRKLAALQQRLQQQTPDLRWVAPEKMHLTLKFLGDVSEQQVVPVSQALDELRDQCRSFVISIEELGMFGAGKVVWAGIRDPDGQLARCHGLCEQFLESLGFSRENRLFQPHLTLARNRSPKNAAKIRQAIEQVSKFTAGTQHVSSLTFYQSTLTKRGPIYESMSKHRFPI
ncbi:MAG: RNA 2',3'-cyclic phosphodiesterase [Phycisphaerales bacterium]|nr:RNA 2',3'-cyclic phosphodiesterase [Phycisphaerales bacterium]